MVKKFKGKDVAFADVNLSEEQIRDGHNPGAGGWPTIRYFNNETGYGGKSYTKKTEKSMCDELGDDEFMEAYVVEAGNVALCTIATRHGCSEKEMKYFESWHQKPFEEIRAQIERLKSMGAGKMTSELRTWLNQRKSILMQLEKQKKIEL